MFNIAIYRLKERARQDRLKEWLDQAGMAVEVVGKGTPMTPIAVDRYDAVIVGRDADLPGEAPGEPIKPLNDAGVSVILEDGALGADVTSSSGECCYYVIDDILSPALMPVLLGGARQSQVIRKLKSDIRARSAAIATIESGHFRFRSMSEARHLATMLALACPNPSQVLIGLTELLVNAVEHGNLAISFEEKQALLDTLQWEDEVERRMSAPEYADRTVTVEFRRDRDACHFDITDEGVGFDPAPFMNFDGERMAAMHGRGIAIACNMGFDEVRYIGRGNRVIATVHHRDSAAA